MIHATKAIPGGSPSLLQNALVARLSAIAPSAFCAWLLRAARSLKRGTTSSCSPPLKHASLLQTIWPRLFAPSVFGPALMVDRPSHMSLCRRAAVRFVRGYQRYISPLLPDSCIYVPTCSQYAIEAIERYGVLKGCWLGLRRILRCNPLHDGGYDPVP